MGLFSLDEQLLEMSAKEIYKLLIDDQRREIANLYLEESMYDYYLRFAKKYEEMSKKN